MAEIWFYHLERGRLETVLPTLLERVRSAGGKAVLRCGSAERVEDLNRLLWVYRDDGFLPHGTAADGHAQRQPIYLTTGEERPNGAEYLVLVDRAESGPDEMEAYRRVILVFDGADPQALAAARAQWKMATAAKIDAVYWSDADGRWTKKLEAKAS